MRHSSSCVVFTAAKTPTKSKMLRDLMTMSTQAPAQGLVMSTPHRPVTSPSTNQRTVCELITHSLIPPSLLVFFVDAPFTRILVTTRDPSSAVSPWWDHIAVSVPGSHHLAFKRPPWEPHWGPQQASWHSWTICVSALTVNASDSCATQPGVRRTTEAGHVCGWGSSLSTSPHQFPSSGNLPFGDFKE